MLLDGLPCALASHRRVKDFFDPFLDKAGLWQGNWQLFAPDPDHMNTWLEVVVTFTDGSKWTLKSPEWQNRSEYEKFIQGRHPKFWDAFRLDRRKAIWPFVADYAVNIAPRPKSGAKAKSVELIRHWWEVPTPAKRAEELAKYGGTLPPPRDQFPSSHSYYTKEYP